MSGEGPIPKQSGKVSLAQLQAIAQQEYKLGDSLPREARLFHNEHDGFRYDFLWSPKEDASRLFVFFSGDAMRAKYDPPVFQRWTWSEHFPGHCLFISDPMLYLSTSLGLAWYAGTENCDPLIWIARCIESIAERSSIEPSRVIAYGSSGGGFAALRLTTLMPRAASIAINPQIDLTRYSAPGVRTPSYFTICLGGITQHEAAARYPDRLILTRYSEHFRRTRIILVQNTLDTHHYEEHYLVFCRSLGADGDAGASGNLNKILFAHEAGHKKAETPEAFAQALDIVTSW